MRGTWLPRGMAIHIYRGSWVVRWIQALLIGIETDTLDIPRIGNAQSRCKDFILH